MNVTAFYDTTTRCRSESAGGCFVSCRIRGVTTPVRNHCIQVNELIIDRLNKLLHLLIRQTDRSTSSTNHQIPIARTLIKAHQ